ncbi:MAG: hypothetical protein HY700_06585 [Gemmatimonadetes bacterium]|nr:hypothetical protein [Gemmatimonadota bacterium]
MQRFLRAAGLKRFPSPSEVGTAKTQRNGVLRLLSARAYHRILKIARTIADLAGAADVEATYVSEAVQYRSLDRAAG